MLACYNFVRTYESQIKTQSEPSHDREITSVDVQVVYNSSDGLAL